MNDFFRCWAGWIALGCGAVAGFGILRSEKLVFWLALAAAAAQVAFWDALFVVFKKAGQDGAIALTAGYFIALLAALPYTTIAAVIVASTLAFARNFMRALRRRPTKSAVTGWSG